MNLSRKRCKADKKYLADTQKGRPFTVHASSVATGPIDTEMAKMLVEEVNAKAAMEKVSGSRMPSLDNAARFVPTSSDGKVAIRDPTPKKATFDVPGGYPSLPTRATTTVRPTDLAARSQTPIHDAEMAAKRHAIRAAKSHAPTNTTNTDLTNTNNSPGPYTSTPGGKYGVKIASAKAATGSRRTPTQRPADFPLAAENTVTSGEKSDQSTPEAKADATWTTDDALPTARVKVVEMPVRASEGKGGKETEAESERGWVEVDLEDDDWELV